MSDALLHVADESGEGCRYCEARWFKDGKGLRVKPAVRVEHEGPGVGGHPQHSSWHPLDMTAGSDATPCWKMALNA